MTAPMESVYSVDPAPDGAGPTSLDVLSFLDTLVNSTEEQCFSARSRSTVLQGLPFGGVPTVLAINFILWLVSCEQAAVFMGNTAHGPPGERGVRAGTASLASKPSSPCPSLSEEAPLGDQE